MAGSSLWICQQS